MRENYIQSDWTESWLENGLVIQVFDKKVTEVTMQIAKQAIFDRRYAAAELSPCPVLVYVKNAVNVDSETKRYYRTEEPYLGIAAIAMVMDNWISKTIASIVFKFQKIPVPVEFFNSEEKALNWLEKYKSSKN